MENIKNKRRTVNEWGQESTTVLEENPNGKIKLTEQPTFTTHRSGWNYAMMSLAPLHNSEGIEFYGFLENEFSWRNQECIEKKIIPFTNPWIGFFHNPQSYPWWFGVNGMPEVMINSPEFKESIKECKGIFTLSEHHAEFCRANLDVPIEMLYHPSEIPEKQFDFDNFLRNPRKRLLNVGYWLRKVNSIYSLPIDNQIYTKTKVLPYEENSPPHRFVENLRKHELKYDQQTRLAFDYFSHESTSYVEELYQLTDEEYDDVFSENIVFMDVYTCSASNSVIEAIARATPILAPPIPPVIEYLGKEYPFYFTHPEEAVQKSFDMDLILKTHQYLKSCPMREKLSGEFFRQAFTDSEIYKAL